MPTSTTSATALAELVWSEITASGLSQADVCAAAGITPKHLSRFVRGHDGMSLDLVDHVLAQIGRVLVLATRPRLEPDDAN